MNYSGAGIGNWQYNLAFEGPKSDHGWDGLGTS